MISEHLGVQLCVCTYSRTSSVVLASTILLKNRWGLVVVLLVTLRNKHQHLNSSWVAPVKSRSDILLLS